MTRRAGLRRSSAAGSDAVVEARRLRRVGVDAMAPRMRAMSIRMRTPRRRCLKRLLKRVLPAMRVEMLLGDETVFLSSRSLARPLARLRRRHGCRSARGLHLICGRGQGVEGTMMKTRGYCATHG